MAEKTVDDYVATLPADQAAIAEALRGVVRTAVPEATESIKWAQPVYDLNGPMAWMKGFTNHVGFGFWRGTELDDPDGRLDGDGDRMRHVKLRTVADVDQARLTAWLHQAAGLNQAKGDPSRRAR